MAVTARGSVCRIQNVVISGPGAVEVREAPDPSPPGRDGAVVSVEATAICGSNLHFYDGDLPVGDGVAVGHEFIGTVTDIGPEVTNVEVGDRAWQRR